MENALLETSFFQVRTAMKMLLQLHDIQDAGSFSRTATEAFSGTWAVIGVPTHRPLSSSFLGLPYRILNINHNKEPLRGLWVRPLQLSHVRPFLSPGT